MPKKDSGSIKMIIRSYYSNQRTGERIWDEPPSGASCVMPATEEMRKMAEVQLQEMQITFGGVASEQPKSKEKQGKKGFFRRSKAEKEDVAEVPNGKIQYRPGSFLARVKKESPSKMARDDTLDPELQKAIALSIAEGGIPRLEASQDSLEPVIRSEIAYYRDEEETFQMAMALSLSEAESARRLSRLAEDEMLRRASKRAASSSNIKAESHMQWSEKEMLDWAIKESKRAAPSFQSPKVASLPRDDAMSCSTDDIDTDTDIDNSSRFRLPTKKSSDDFSDKKMPAEPSKTRGALGHRQPVGTNVVLESQPRPYGQPSIAGTSSKSSKVASLAEPSMRRGALGHSVRKKQPVGTIDLLENKPCSSKSSKVASLSVDDAMSYSTDNNDDGYRLPIKKPSDDFSEKNMPAEPSMTRGALGHSVRKKKLVVTNDVLKSQPRSYGQSSFSRTNKSHGSEPRSYERSSSGGSRRQLVNTESVPRETAHVEPGSPERSVRIGGSRRA
jgi:hypothetical protein